MKAEDIKADDSFIVAPGRSVLTAKRGMAHVGGKITLADINTEKPAETMADFLEKGRVVVDEEALEAAQQVADGKAARLKKQTVEGEKRAEAAEVEEAKKAEAAKVVTQADIIAAIGLLDKGNPEHWTTNGAPQVTALEGILGKQISAADRDAAWAAMPESKS